MDNPRLLVVDDDPYTRLALNAFFTRGGWRVSLAASVAEALPLLDDAPHCLILDLNLPDGAGEVVLEEVRAKSRETQVVVCSGVDDPGRLDEVRRLTPEVMMGKPIDLGAIYRLREDVPQCQTLRIDEPAVGTKRLGAGSSPGSGGRQ